MGVDGMRIVVTGTGGASGYAVALQAEQLGYQVLWADADPLCPAMLANSHRAQLLPPAAEGVVYLETLAKAAKSFGAHCVSFNTDAEVRYAAGEADALSDLGLSQWVPSARTVKLCSDKAEFTDYLSGDTRFRTPASLSASDLEFRFPDTGVFVKKRSGSGGEDSMVCSCRLELEAWLNRNSDGLIQEVMTGQEFSADCLYTGSDLPLVVARRRLQTHPVMEYLRIAAPFVLEGVHGVFRSQHADGGDLFGADRVRGRTDEFPPHHPGPE
jgi:carbamoyl-phosphate synthase large subunit